MGTLSWTLFSLVDARSFNKLACLVFSVYLVAAPPTPVDSHSVADVVVHRTPHSCLWLCRAVGAVSVVLAWRCPVDCCRNLERIGHLCCVCECACARRLPAAACCRSAVAWQRVGFHCVGETGVRVSGRRTRGEILAARVCFVSVGGL